MHNQTAIRPGPLSTALAFTGIVLTLSAGPVQAQSGAPAPATTSTPTAAETRQLVKSALERAAQHWGSAGVMKGGGTAGAAQSGAAPAVGQAVFTGEAAVAGVALAQAAVLLTATGLALDVHLSRSGSLWKYGNPYGMPKEDIAFPLNRQERAKRARLARPTVPEPFPVPEPDDGESDKPRAGRIYATYTRYNRKTGLYYSGRTSMIIDLNKDWRKQARMAVAARHRNRHNHDDENAEPGGPAFLDAVLDTYAAGGAVDYSQRYRDVGYLAIRGREQQLIDYHGARRAKARGIKTFVGGAQSDTKPGEALTENAIRGVARDNANGEIFHAAANLAFGEIAPYTGDTRYE